MNEIPILIGIIQKLVKIYLAFGIIIGLQYIPKRILTFKQLEYDTVTFNFLNNLHYHSIN